MKVFEDKILVDGIEYIRASSLPTVEELETFIESRCGIPIIVTLGGGNLAEDIHKRLIGECNHVFVSAHNAGTKDIAMECGNCGKIIKPGE